MPLTPASHPNVASFRLMQEQSRLIEQVQVVFVVGPPKCGTTWVQTTLNGHPHAVAHGEGHLATRLLGRLSDAMRGFNDDQAARAKESRSKVFSVLQLDEADMYLIARQAIDRILVHYLSTAAGTGKTRIGAVIDKTPDHARHMPALFSMYPWAKFICVTRDVRDAAVSAWHHRAMLGTNAHASIAELAPAFARDVWGPMMLLARSAASRMPGGHYTEVRYEDYKADAAGEVRRLLGFIGLDASDESVAACIHAGDFKRQTRGREPGVEAVSFHRKGVVGDWTNHLSPAVADQTVRAAEQVLSLLSATDTAAIEAKPRSSGMTAA